MLCPIIRPYFAENRIPPKTELEAIQMGLRRAETTYNLLVRITAI